MQEVSFGIGEIGRDAGDSGSFGSQTAGRAGGGRRGPSADVVCPWAISEEEENETDAGGIYAGREGNTENTTDSARSISPHNSHPASIKSPTSPKKEHSYSLAAPWQPQPQPTSRLTSPPGTPATPGKTRCKPEFIQLNRLGSDSSETSVRVLTHHKLPSTSSKKDTQPAAKSLFAALKEQLPELESRIDQLYEQVHRIETRFTSLVNQCLLELCKIENVPISFLREMHQNKLEATIKKSKQRTGKEKKIQGQQSISTGVLTNFNRELKSEQIGALNSQSEKLISPESSTSSNAELFV